MKNLQGFELVKTLDDLLVRGNTSSGRMDDAYALAFKRNNQSAMSSSLFYPHTFHFDASTQGCA